MNGNDTQSVLPVASGRPSVVGVRAEEVSRVIGLLNDKARQDDTDKLFQRRSQFGNPFGFARINLATLGNVLNTSKCYGLIYRREGSTPGGRITLNIGGEFVDFAPGMRLIGDMEQVLGFISARSALNGFANIVTLLTPDAQFMESDAANYPGEMVAPVDLGSMSYFANTSLVFVKDTAPTNGTFTQGFDVTGWKHIRCFLDANYDGSGVWSSFDIIPYFLPQRVISDGQATATWKEMGGLRIGIPDSTPTGKQFRGITIDLDGSAGRLYLMPTNPGSGINTQMGVIAQGVY